MLNTPANISEPAGKVIWFGFDGIPILNLKTEASHIKKLIFTEAGDS